MDGKWNDKEQKKNENERIQRKSAGVRDRLTFTAAPLNVKFGGEYE